MQRKARSIPVSSLWFQGYGAWQDLTRTSFLKEIDKAGSLLEQAAIVNNVKKGTIRFPLA